MKSFLFFVFVCSSVRGDGTPFSQDEQSSLIDSHNKYRSQVDPPASDMQQMVWDNDMANLAQQWADKCTWEHGNPPNNYDWIGQNLYASSPTDTIATDAVSDWWSEKDSYDYNSNSCASGKVCGHYTQLVWAKSTNLGCGRSEEGCFNGMTIVVCNYHPGGNFNGGKPYNT